MSRLARSELILALVGLALGVLTMIYLAFTLLVERQVCYGITASKLECLPIDISAAERFVVVLGYVLLPLVFATLAARWQLRAQEPSARATAFGTMATCVILLVGIIIPGSSGPGFFLLPTALIMLAATVVGAIVWWRSRTEVGPQAR